MRRFFYLSCIILSGCTQQAEQEALGTLERDRVLLKSTANEIIQSTPISEGSQVKQGTLLVQLDDRRQKAIVARVEAELAQAAAHFAELRNGARIEDVDAAKARVVGAKAELTVAEKNYQRAKRLVKQGLSAQSDLDKMLASKESAEANLESATKALLALTNGTRQEELDQAEAALNAVQAQLDLENHILSELSVKATRDGYLDSLPWNVGERVPKDATVAVLLAEQNPFARVYIPEPWRAKLKAGDILTVKVDGIKQTFQGRLRWISNDPAFTPYYALNADDRARLVYLAEVDLLQGETLPTGVPAQVLLPQ